MSTRSKIIKKRNKKYSSSNSSFEETDVNQSAILKPLHVIMDRDSQSPRKLKDDEAVYDMISELPVTPEGHLAKQIILSMKDILENNLEKFQQSIVTDLKNENTKLKNDILGLAKEIEVQNKKIIDLEINQSKLDQYGRRNNLEISGIPDEISHHDLQESVVEILTEIGVVVNRDEIEACHRLQKGKNFQKRFKENHYSFYQP